MIRSTSALLRRFRDAPRGLDCVRKAEQRLAGSLRVVLKKEKSRFLAALGMTGGGEGRIESHVSDLGGSWLGAWGGLRGLRILFRISVCRGRPEFPLRVRPCGDVCLRTRRACRRRRRRGQWKRRDRVFSIW